MDYNNFYSLLAKKDKTLESMKELAKESEHIANNMFFPAKEIADKILASQEMKLEFIPICKAWVQSMANREKWEKDLRNEESVKRSKQLLFYMEKINCFFENNDTFVITFINESKSWHRTNQQTFSNLIFSFMDKIKEKDWEGIEYIRMEMKYYEGEFWWKMPLI